MPNVIERAGVSGVFRDRNHRINIGRSRVFSRAVNRTGLCTGGVESGLTSGLGTKL